MVSVYAALNENAPPRTDTSPPRVLANTLNHDPLEDDDILRSSKTWSWTCLDDVSASCTYRYKIDTAPLIGVSCASHTFNTESYGHVFQVTVGFENSADARVTRTRKILHPYSGQR